MHTKKSAGRRVSTRALRVSLIQAIRRDQPKGKSSMSVLVAKGPLPFEPDGVRFFTQKQMAEKRGVSLRTIVRDIRRYGAKVHDFIGIQPVFTKQEFERLEAKRKQKIARRFQHELEHDDSDAILNIDELRAIRRDAQRKNGKAKR
jgi:hypothetical protein